MPSRRLMARLRALTDAALDGAGALADRDPRLERWRARRFHAELVRRLPGLAINARHGVRYYVHPDDEVVGAAIRRDGAFDADKIEAILGLMHEHGLPLHRLIDVGANIGTTTIEILRRLDRVTAVAFEPDPTNFQLLELNLRANGLGERVRTHRAAVGDVTGTVTLERSAANHGDHRVRSEARGIDGAYAEAERETLAVPIVRLDDVRDLTPDPANLLHVDTQGFEGHVLAGASRLLSARPSLVVELWPYGLDRAGGREPLFAALGPYSRLFDLGSSPPRPITHDELPALARELAERPPGEARPDHTDLFAMA